MRFFLSVILIFCFSSIFAQEDACKLLIQQGIYKHYLRRSSGSFQQDLKTYFESSRFREDYRDRKWSGSIGVVVDAVPINLGANASDAEINSFQQQIRNSRSLSVSSNFYDLSVTAIPDIELAKEYRLCVENVDRTGFKIYPTITDKEVTFVISYRKDNSRDPMPRVTFFDIKNATNIRNAPVIGSAVQDNFVVTADRDINKDLTLVLQTDRKVATYPVPAEPTGFNKDFPVGTVITSFLNWQSFQEITKNNSQNQEANIWTSKFSMWSPADGRSVPNSKYSLAASTNYVPDLRGIFLRGLNSFDPSNGPAPRNASISDPDNRVVGSFQNDAFQGHTHYFNGEVNSADNPDGPQHNTLVATHHTAVSQTTPMFENRNYVKSPKNDGTNGQPRLSKETRPKNVTVYYYIRIN